MAKAATVTNDIAERSPITLRGSALLALIAAADGGYMFLTQDEGADIVAEGNAVVTVDPAYPTAPDGLATVILTDAGKAIVAALPPAAPVVAKPAGPALKLVIRNDIPMPDIIGRTRGRASRYNFDAMKVGDSFHLPKSDAIPNPAEFVASAVTGARNKYAVDVTDDAGAVVMETVKVKTYEINPATGKRVNKDGHFIQTGEVDVQKPKLNFVRDFAVAAVDETDPEGVGARVWRIK